MSMTIISTLSRHLDALERPKAPVIGIRTRPHEPETRPDRLALIDALEREIRRVLDGRNLVSRDPARRRWDTLRVEFCPRGWTWAWAVRLIGMDDPPSLYHRRAYITVGLVPFDVDYSDCAGLTCQQEAEMFASVEHVEECARMWARQVMDELFPAGHRPGDGDDGREDSICSSEY